MLRFCGNPEQYGGLKPSENILEANISQCQNYLPLIAEGKILVKGAPVEFTEAAVEFDDGSSETVDAVIFATGFDLNLPFLSDDMRHHLDVDDTHLDLYQHTFHPDLPGLAFVGQYCQVGPYFPTLELQSRWVAMVFNNIRPLPSRESMLGGIAAHKEWRQHFHEVVFHDMVLLFAQAAGVEPDLTKRADLAKALMFGPLSPTQFRMEGHGCLPDADQRFAQEAAQFNCLTTSEPDAEESQGLDMLAANLKDEKWLVELVGKLR